ncbi:MAG: cobalamin-binding protein, partial [Deltaproteobacteria bacterium]|nr:cobalamin-binding protein [Deltaproteobacteria bacterium]
MSKLAEVKELTEKGKQKLIQEAVKGALAEGNAATLVLDTMISAMGIVGDKFKRSEIFVPEMLMAAHTMKKGVEVLQPLLAGQASVS